MTFLLTGGSQLDVSGGASTGDGREEHGISAKNPTITVETGATLRAYAGTGTGFSGYGLHNFTGVMYASGATEIYVGKTSFGGTDSGVGIQIGGGTLVAMGSTHNGLEVEGEYGENSVRIHLEAAGLAARKLNGITTPGTLTNSSTAFLNLKEEDIDRTDYSGGFDLSGVQKSRFYPNVGGGWPCGNTGCGEIPVTACTTD